ncbi:kelch-domain-containing protein [Magnaporthiopsis poae ATCC 64411]|uniref:Kelch-domain-containing protein n=1 Tax=Magnaporthiopsis poae (strain ATCC 64411 / 73-15) TaxID=644358 RepID=A0A0C4DQB0_MAGP6|nr:kelch-domain-containing protein [Magnaporthiopsis poae ATCC 64411]
MSFLFKSKKNQDRSLSSRDGPPPSSQNSIQNAAARVARDEKSSLQRSTPTGSLNSIDNDGSMGSPDQGGYAARRPPQGPPPVQPALDQQPVSDLPFRNGGAVQPPAQVQMSSPNANLYPWTQRRLTYTSSHPSPFPRYGAAVNSTSSKEGDIYVMGGLINSATVKGDLWMIEAGGNLACYPLATTAEGPGPRVGHASLLVGNAFIVYGGDTKIDETDVLDETLYLLNTSTRQWSRSLPAGPRPSGRYGHSLNIIGSKIYIFGGQVEGYFMNDLSAFDLNQLQMPNNRWEMLLSNSDSGGPPVGKVPPARTNHTMITYNDKMYLFGGTNGFQWFNDVWCYDSQTNSWTMLDCIGYIPIPREGHAAALVDDVMYIFGGRTEEGSDLGDLAAFRITSRRWYTFQNMGPSPSPRSGHSMTTVGKAVVVVGGEPSSAATAVNDLGLVYMLDTTKIRYPPNDSASQSRNGSMSRQRSASNANEAGMQAANRALPLREGSNGPEGRKMMATVREAGVSSPANGMRSDMANPQGAPNQSKLPRAAGASPPAGPPPQGQPPRPTVNTSVSSSRPSRNTSAERAEIIVSPVTPIQNPAIPEAKAAEATTNGRRTPTKAAPKPEPVAEAPKPKTSRSARSQGSVDSSTEPALKAAAAPRPASPPPPTRQNSNPLSRRSSGRNSQTVALLKELDMARSRNAWYASELELARKAGYTPNATLSPVLEGRAAETFDDEDKPLIEALLAMRQELASVQASVDKQAVLAARQIAEAERQRDVAIQEAVYAKAKLAGRSGGSTSSTPQMDVARDVDDRSSDMSRKLAAALNSQRDLQSQVERLSSEIEAEKRARKLADETTNAAQKRMSALEMYKQQTSLETESLRAELHMLQREAREQSIVAAEAVAQSEMLRVEKNEFEAKYNEVSGASEERSTAIASLRDALVASNETKELLERKLQEEQEQREAIGAKLTALKAEHEASIAELESLTRKLQVAELMAESHAKEAKLHKQALVGGFDQIAARSVGKDSKADSERVSALQGQLNAASALARKYQQQADAASDKLRSAEERIAGLEAYQEQASREGVTIRKQLQAALRDTQTLQASASDLKNQLAKQQLESNAVTVQHNTLKSILSERGISPTGVRSRGSPRGDSPETSARVRELEQQLESTQTAHEENKQAFMAQAQASENAYREKLSQLENDYQSAVHYVKGTEKMLKKLKEELARYKNENSRLKNEVIELEDKTASAPSDWESEKASLTKKIETLQSEMMTATTQLERQMQAVRKELEAAKRERDSAVKHSEEASQRINTSKKDLEQLQRENALLQERAQDAEEKVSLLLDQVETSVDNYRRRSRQVASMGSDQFRDSSSSAGGASAATSGAAVPTTNGNVETTSEYGGNLEERNSAALDSLANELETLRTHWEATNKNYRLSNTFDFEATTPTSTTAAPARKGEKDDNGLSESLADWRKRLDNA